MEITYKNQHTFSAKELEDLFLSVEWSSGRYPEKLVVAMENYETVCSAWDGDRLVGLLSAMDDHVMTAYIHYLLVRPEYQGMGIGKKLVEMAKQHYQDYLRLVLVSYNEEIPFYEHCGFRRSEDSSPMFITELWT